MLRSFWLLSGKTTQKYFSPQTGQRWELAKVRRIAEK